MIYLRLFFEYFKTGLFAVGGGMATIPFLYRMSDSLGWFTYSDITDMIAVSESTPGPIGVNMATYAGYSLAGIPGALVATAGLVMPSLIISCIIAGFLKVFRDNRYVRAAFYTLRPASTGLIAAAGVGVVTQCLIHIGAFCESRLLSDLADWRMLLLAAVLIVLMYFVKPTKKLHPVVFIALSAAVGIIFGFAG